MTANTVETQGTTIEIETGSPGVYATIGEAVSFDGPGGQAKVIDTTNLASTRKEKRMGLADEGQLQISFNRYFDDTGQNLARAARSSRAEKNFRITYDDGTVETFAAYVLGFSTSVAVDDVVRGKMTVEITGEVTQV